MYKAANSFEGFLKVFQEVFKLPGEVELFNSSFKQNTSN